MSMDRQIERKKWPPKRIAAYGLAGGVVLLLAGALIFGDTRSTLNVDEERISIATAEEGLFQEFIPVTGSVQPIKTVYMDALDGGRVEGIYVEEGSMVEEGDSLLRMANTNVQMEMMFREADLYEQMNNLRSTRLAMEQNRLTLKQQLAEVEYQTGVQARAFERAKVLREKGLISDEEFQRAEEDHDYWHIRRELVLESQHADSVMRELQVEQLEQSVARMQQNLGIVREKFNNLVLKAPISGQLSSLNAEIGELKSGGERLGQIDVLDGYKVRASIDEYYIGRIGTGLAATCELSGENYRMRVAKIYPEVKDSRFEVDLVFDGAFPREIRRGQTLQIRLALGDPATALVIPRGGFYQTTGGNWIYVVDASGSTATKRSIRLGRQNPQQYEVLDGLAAGERVITSSYDSFGEYEKLMIK